MTRLLGTQPSIAAFLDLIAWSEIGPKLLAVSDDGYNVLVGSTPDRPLLFTDYSHHPRILNKRFNSTAAGRYQIIFPTWAGVSGELGLTSFDPESQDLAAIELLHERHAFASILAGKIGEAITLCHNEWASFPGGNSGQPQHSEVDLLNAYEIALAKYRG